MRKAAIVLLAVVLLAWWLTEPRGAPPGRIPESAGNSVDGEQVFHAGGCASCHGDDLAGGHEMRTPFGTFRVPNITPHLTAGIGDWSLAEFADAMLAGVSPEGRHYYPAFPYTSYTRMSGADVANLKAYLDGFAPVENDIAGPELGFPWNLRRGIGLWKMRYFDDSWFVEGGDGEAFERGRYLVEALGHCGECHTPRGALGGFDRSAWLAGAPSPDGEGRVPDITPQGEPLADWSEKDIAYYLESGFTPDFDTVGGSMVKVQENFARLSDEDRAAVAAYLKALPPARR